MRSFQVGDTAVGWGGARRGDSDGGCGFDLLFVLLMGKRLMGLFCWGSVLRCWDSGSFGFGGSGDFRRLSSLDVWG